MCCSLVLSKAVVARARFRGLAAQLPVAGRPVLPLPEFVSLLKLQLDPLLLGWKRPRAGAVRLEATTAGPHTRASWF